MNLSLNVRLSLLALGILDHFDAIHKLPVVFGLTFSIPEALISPTARFGVMSAPKGGLDSIQPIAGGLRCCTTANPRLFQSARMCVGATESRRSSAATSVGHRVVGRDVKWAGWR